MAKVLAEVTRDALDLLAAKRRKLAHILLDVSDAEGDFSPGELKDALDRGFFPLSLGTGRLRTETAALEACFEINFLNR